MEQPAALEIQPAEIQPADQLRVVQRRRIIQDHIKSTESRERREELFPSDRLRPNTAVQEIRLRELAEYLKKDAHTVLFGLAATSNNPIELQNIFFAIANLKNVKSSYWKFEDSENHFLRRSLPGHINVSEGAVNQAETLLVDRKAMDKNSNTQHLLESFLYVMSAENVPLEVKRRVLSDFYSAKALIPDSSGTKPRQKAYGLGSSFWSHVDGSWIDPDLAPVSAPKSHIVRGVVGGIKDRLKRPEVTPPDVAPAPATIIPEPDGRSAESEDLSRLTVNELEERLFQNDKRAYGLNFAISRMGFKDAPLIDPSSPLRLAEKDQMTREFQDLEKKSIALTLELKKQLAPNEYRAKLNEIQDRIKETRIQEEAAALFGTETPAQRTSRIRRMLGGLNDYLAQPSEETTKLRERLSEADKYTFDTLKQAAGKLAGKRTQMNVVEAKPEDLTNKDLEEMIFDNEKRARQNLRALRKASSDAIESNPSISVRELMLLPSIQQRNSEYEDLADKYTSLGSEMERRFKPEELTEVLSRIKARVEEAEAQEATGEPLAQKTSRIKGMLAGAQDFLAQPTEEAARLRQADREASETLARTLGSLAKKVPGLSRKIPPTPEEPSAAMEDLSGFTLDELEEKLYQNRKRGIYLRDSRYNMYYKSKELNPSLHYDDFERRPEVGRMGREIEELDQNSHALFLQMEKRLTPDELRAMSSRIGDRIFEEAEAEASQTETPTERTSRIRKILGGLNDYLAQPTEETTKLRERLREADKQTFDSLKQALGTLATKASTLFTRTPKEIAEEAEEEETVISGDLTPQEAESVRPSRVGRWLREINEYLAQPTEEAAKLRQADREAFETLKTTARKASSLFRLTPKEAVQPSTSEPAPTSVKETLRNLREYRQLLEKARKLAFRSPQLSVPQLEKNLGIDGHRARQIVLQLNKDKLVEMSPEDLDDLYRKNHTLQLLNDRLIAEPKDPRVSVNSYLPISILRDGVASIDPDKIHGGKVELNELHKITIKGVDVSDPDSPAAKSTLDIVLSSSPSGIEAFVHRVNTASAGGFDTEKVEEALKNINSIVLSQINKEIADRNPSWEALNAEITNEQIFVRFDKKI